ncbi:MAG: MFS transporter, partial [Lacipirellulaceae bacterium]
MLVVGKQLPRLVGHRTLVPISQKNADQPARRSEIAAWVLYDWANSGYAVLIITVFVAYLQNDVFPAAVWGSTGPIVWAWSIALSMLIASILSPFLGAIADGHACKWLWLAGTAYSGSVCCLLLGIMPTDYPWLIVFIFFLANLSFELSLTFYNGFLPELAEEDRLNQISSWGYGLGYVGGGIALLISVLIISYGQYLGLTDRICQLKFSIVFMGLWWGIFTLPAVLLLRDKHVAESGPRSTLDWAQYSWRDVVSTIRSIRKYKMLALFLLAFLCYNDGVQTVLSQSSTFALQELSFTESELVKVILMIQFAALPGAIAVGWASDQWGQKRVLMWCLAVWIILLTLAYFIESKHEFWILGGAVAMVMGGTQSVSRAVMGVMTPQKQSAKFFGFYNFSGKATGFFGSFMFGLIL